MLNFNSMILTTLSISVLSGISAAYASNGGAFNGPNLAGQSIPVEVDHAITKVEVAAALKVCSTELAKSIFEQIYKVPYAQSGDVMPDFSLQAYPSSVDEKVYQGDYWGQLSPQIVSGKGYSVSGGTLRWAPPGQDYSKKQFYSYYILATTPGSPNDQQTQFILVGGFPELKFDSEFPDSAYDEYGNVIESQVILKNLHLVLPAHYGAAEPFSNQDTMKQISLIANEVAYTDCLLAEIQK